MLLVAMLAVVVGAVFIARMLLRRRDSQNLNREERERLAQAEGLLGRMEQRLSNLETILMSGGRKDDKQ